MTWAAHGLAQRYLVQALHLAEAAGDGALMSEVLAATSVRNIRRRVYLSAYVDRLAR